MNKGAILSPCGAYRYRLWRQWDDLRPILVWVMMNPSTADDVDDDSTIRRVVDFSKRFGFGGIDVLNVFALRSTDPRRLLAHPDPFGPDNERTLMDARHRHLLSNLVVAWGNPLGGRRLANYYQRARVALCTQNPQCLGANKNGHPKHPLYLRAAAALRPWPCLPNAGMAGAGSASPSEPAAIRPPVNHLVGQVPKEDQS